MTQYVSKVTKSTYKNEGKPFCIEGIFSDPDSVREFALSQDYFPEETHPSGGAFRGYRSVQIKDLNESIYNEMNSALLKKFRLNQNHDTILNAWFHYVPSNSEDDYPAYRDMHDSPNCAGIIFLNKTYPEEFSFDVWTVSPDSMVRENPDYHVEPLEIKDFIRDFTVFPVWNKCAMYRSVNYRRFENCYGEDVNDSPLVISFNFKVILPSK